MKERGGEFTFAGAFDDSFAGYSDTMRGNHLAINAPMLDPHAPDSGMILEPDAPYPGTVGAFDSHAAQFTPAGPWMPDYNGNLPLYLQPKVPNVEPWLDEHAP